MPAKASPVVATTLPVRSEGPSAASVAAGDTRAVAAAKATEVNAAPMESLTFIVVDLSAMRRNAGRACGYCRSRPRRYAGRAGATSSVRRFAAAHQFDCLAAAVSICWVDILVRHAVVLLANAGFGQGEIPMKNAVRVLALMMPALMLGPGLASAAEKPDWAFPVTEKEQPAPRIEGTRLRPPPSGSTLSITRAKADDMFDIPNWYPDMYPAMPKVVQFGNKDTQTRACGSCHLPTGNGHDESAYVAGLPVAYFVRQLADWKSGDRK